MSGRAACSAAFPVLASLLALWVGCGGSAESGRAVAFEGGDEGALIDANQAGSVDTSTIAANADASGDGIGDATILGDVDATQDASADAITDATNDAPETAADAMRCGASPGAGASDCEAGRPVACDFMSCPTGCCDGNGVCQPGTAAAACGAGASTCQACPAGAGCIECPPGTICSAERLCGCSPQSCPSGCCSGKGLSYEGTCQPGTLDNACGRAGTGCANCAFYTTACGNCGQGLGLPYSVGGGNGTCSNQQCVYPPPPCPFGCVDARGICQPGASNTLCGNGGSDCTDCTASGAECSDQQCTPIDDAGVCNVQTCPSGCCDSRGICESGSTNAMCGTAGINCQNCAGLGEFCSNQRCGAADGGSACGWFNCAGCCDASGTCIPVNSDTQCGSLGSRCADCSTLGDQCLHGACTAPDGNVVCSQSCPGCCDSNNDCQIGLIDTQCGAWGQACQDCTRQSPASTCDVGVAPTSTRTCTGEQTTCPASYPGCPSSLQRQAIVRQAVCSTTDLQNVAVACAGGSSTLDCRAFFDGAGACGNCLDDFDTDFATPFAVRACALPYLDVACNHIAACLDDCLTQACTGCLMDYQTQCEIDAQSGTCASYVQASACVTQALNGPATFCNPTTYQGNFGAWLQAVGAAYCGK